MINNVFVGEEIVITTDNKVGLLADIAKVAVDHGINIDAVLGYKAEGKATILLITRANLPIMSYLKEKDYREMKETEVVVVDLQNKPGAIKVITTELKKNKIDIEYIYVTSCSCGGGSRMVLQTTDNELTMSLLMRYTDKADKPGF